MNHHDRKTIEARDNLAAGLDNAKAPTPPARQAWSTPDTAALTDVDGNHKTGAQLLSAALETEIRKAQK